MSDEPDNETKAVIIATAAIVAWLTLTMLTMCEARELKEDLRDLRQELRIHQGRGH